MTPQEAEDEKVLHSGLWINDTSDQLWTSKCVNYNSRLILNHKNTVWGKEKWKQTTELVTLTLSRGGTGGAEHAPQMRKNFFPQTSLGMCYVPVKPTLSLKHLGRTAVSQTLSEHTDTHTHRNRWQSFLIMPLRTCNFHHVKKSKIKIKDSSRSFDNIFKRLNGLETLFFKSLRDSEDRPTTDPRTPWERAIAWKQPYLYTCVYRLLRKTWGKNGGTGGGLQLKTENVQKTTGIADTRETMLVSVWVCDCVSVCIQFL